MRNVSLSLITHTPIPTHSAVTNQPRKSPVAVSINLTFTVIFRTGFLEICINKSKLSILNPGDNDECEAFICDCDKKAAECFAEAPYNEENAHLPSDRCK